MGSGLDYNNDLDELGSALYLDKLSRVLPISFSRLSARDIVIMLE